MKFRRITGSWRQSLWQTIRPYGRYFYYWLFPRRRPDYFQAAWTYPTVRSGIDRPDLPRPDPLTCFFLPMTDWHARIQRSQHLAGALADAGCQCVYLNPHLGLEYLRPYLLDPSAKMSKLDKSIWELHIHLPREHALDSRLLRPEEVSAVVRGAGGLIEARGIRRSCLIVSLPVWLHVAERLRQLYRVPILYDCHDWLPGFKRVSPDILGMEASLLKTCDAVVFSSQYLMDRVRRENPSICRRQALIRNGVNPHRFLTKQASIYGAPGGSVRRPTVGYVGALDHWFDIDAVRVSAEAHPEWTLVLAGRIEDESIRSLQRYPNIEFTGEIPHAAISGFLESCDVAMIPFMRNDLTAAANPVKLYEYFCVGLPVVSTRLPEVELYSDLVYLADTSAQFPTLIAAAMREDSPALQERRKAIAGLETWAARAALLLDEIVSLPLLSGAGGSNSRRRKASTP